MRVLHDGIGIQRGLVTTIHDPTNTQTVTDRADQDPRLGRSALTNLIPTSTNSATAVALIVPELRGKLDSIAVRAPVLNASLTDCAFQMARNTTKDEVNALLRAAATTGPLQGILGQHEDAAAGQQRLRARPAQQHRRCAVHARHRRQPGQGDGRRRQRMGLTPYSMVRPRRLLREGLRVTEPAVRRGLLLVTLCYCTFMLSDGALRMLVLLHLHGSGQTPFSRWPCCCSPTKRLAW